MTAYFFAHLNVRNLNWVNEYQEHVPEIVRSYGGKFIAVAKNMPNAVELVEGSLPAPQGVAIITFPSMEKIKAFLDDPQYAPYKKMRIDATESTIWAFENDATAKQFVGQ